MPLESVDFSFEGHPAPGDIYEYKGHYIVGSADENVNNIPFFKLTKKAIDLVDELPRSTQRGIKLIKAIIYDPPLPNGKPRQAKKNSNPNDAIVHMYPGIYTFGPDLNQPAPMIVYRDVGYLAPISIGYALVSNSLYARLHKNIRTLAKQIKKTDRTSVKYKTFKKNYDLMKTLVTASDLAVVEKYNCRLMLEVLSAMKAWGESSQNLSGMRNALIEQRCEQ